MKTFSALISSLLLVAACGASQAPQSLVNARVAYAQAESNQATTALAPSDLHNAKVALDKAEAEFEDDDDSPQVETFAYLAQRAAERAVAIGEAAAARSNAKAAMAARTQAQEALIAEQQAKLSSAEDAMQNQQSQIEQKNQQIVQAKQETEKERQARLVAEKKANDAMVALAKSVEMKQDDARGTVITLSGSVLFATGKAAILPGAQNQLNAVADALKTQAEASFVVEGHTDNQGSDSVNAELSLKRANAVKDYLIVRGVSANAVSAVGQGASKPVADNKSSTGRAMNRRVEIVVAPPQTAQR